jgi:putative membrane protein insertion efficiency factor
MSTTSVDTGLHQPESSAGTDRRSLGVRGLVLLVRLYQGVRVGRVSPCRFTPTCSTYAIEAVERHGALRGASLTARRLGRCRPGGPSGYDPVPE